MAELTLGALTGSQLQQLLQAQDITPGDAPSYQLCKTIYAAHPLGAKIAEYPVAMAMSDPRRITVPAGPEELLVEEFWKQWRADGWDRAIFNTAVMARVYGVATMALAVQGQQPNSAMDPAALPGKRISPVTFDPLNTAGSLVLNQDPNSPDFQRMGAVTVQGQAYHPSRTVSIMNENPLYIEYTQSAFGYVGRSVYQRALFPLKSFLNTMIANDMVAVKVGLLIHSQKQTGSAVDAVSQAFSGIKRALLKVAQTNQVLTIGSDDKIESINLQNLDAPLALARKNILEDIASSASTPAQILNAETFAQGFGEGTEDAKHVAQFIDRVREWCQPLYDLADRVTRARAWTPELFKIIQQRYPEDWGNKKYNEAFYEWCNSFTAAWPNLLEEPDSEKIKVEDVKLKAVIAMLETLLPQLDPFNKQQLVEWACDNFNALKLVFTSPIQLDLQQLMDFMEQQAQNAQDLADSASQGGEQGINEPPQPGRPFAASDSVARLTDAVRRLPERRRART